ncbi:hypothetical protein N781_06500 [Pontibacillus halophilus JSM 076056 = DSM 19796]|uniref:Permease n=1 Tax=Pontibacillus halophilus JSM 076056 = DSM 19796 TaxID=1385510 RepID=A0A0A5GC42_9BACI|nr:hypothetical protein [Pontibacillus halophilus]KGX90756.1 hypothetical protein N781_06500 [Pontibacillus halophilus JSM 076056 = DSM 19796]
MRPVFCKYCSKPIDDRDELITATNYARIYPYHYLCYQELEQETTTVQRVWKPLNDGLGTYIAFLMLILSGWFAFTDTLGAVGDIIAALSLYPIGLRVLSFFLYELRVPNQSGSQ